MALVKHRKAFVGGFCCIALLGVLGTGVSFMVRPHATAGDSHSVSYDADEPPPADDGAIPVRTIKPRQDPNFVISVEEPAYVEPYFQADLLARVAGPVKYIAKDIGDSVTRGELLVEIDVPDLAQEVAQKAAVVEQREAEVRWTVAQVKIADQAEEVAQDTIQEREADLRQAQSTVRFRQSEYNRFRTLADRTAVTPDVVDERLRDFEAAQAAVDSARAALKKASADAAETLAKAEAARADVLLKQTLVEVARKDHARALALAEFAKIRAPFDGVITNRRVDPGSFVQNATTARTEPFLSIARTDLVTISMKLPDSYADFVTTNTEAIIQMNKRPGEWIEGRVTRFAPVLQDKDRRMRVLVDLYNGSQEDFARMMGRGVAGQLSPLAAHRPLPLWTLFAVSRNQWRQDFKGNTDSFPLYPRMAPGSQRRPRPLFPGMYGNMKLLLRHFDNVYLLPSGAVISRGGKRYIIQVKDGVAHLFPVHVEVDDGRLSKVAIVDREPSGKSSGPEMLRELTGNEEIIASGQGEISEGQAVRATLTDW